MKPGRAAAATSCYWNAKLQNQSASSIVLGQLYVGEM